MWKEVELTGWGRLGRARCLAARPEALAELEATLASARSEGAPVIAHAMGRSYGDCALPVEGGRAVITRRLDRFLAFDEASGIVTVEPGVTFKEMMAVFLPRGWLMPVSPGTAYATLGGAVANDVHGKNHETAGSLGRHVSRLEVVLPSGETVICSPGERPELFDATIGGVGLTGFITAVTLRLKRVPSNAVRVRERRIGDLDSFLAAFQEAAGRAAYSVGWIDVVAEGRSFGRGILETAEHSPEGVPIPRPRSRRVPLDFPTFALSRPAVRLFNAAYWRRVPTAGRERLAHIGSFFYPLDAIQEWNRIYGRPGFRQFQCVVPFAAGERALVRLLEAVRGQGSASFLAVLKALGAEDRGLLSFPMPGWTLALDMPERSGTAELFATLERITLDHGGRIYLAKDSSLSASGLAASYPHLGRFREIMAGLGEGLPHRSRLGQRLGLVA